MTVLMIDERSQLNCATLGMMANRLQLVWPEYKHLPLCHIFPVFLGDDCQLGSPSRGYAMPRHVRRTRHALKRKNLAGTCTEGRAAPHHRYQSRVVAVPVLLTALAAAAAATRVAAVAVAAVVAGVEARAEARAVAVGVRARVVARVVARVRTMVLPWAARARSRYRAMTCTWITSARWCASRSRSWHCRIVQFASSTWQVQLGLAKRLGDDVSPRMLKFKEFQLDCLRACRPTPGWYEYWWSIAHPDTFDPDTRERIRRCDARHCLESAGYTV